MKEYVIDEISLYKLLKNAGQAAATQALIDAGVVSPVMSITDAYRKYGRNDVSLWEKMGLINRIQKGQRAKQYFSVSELNQAALYEKRYDYLTVEERKASGS